MRILVAEDNDLLRDYVCELLAGCGHTVDVVENGKELLEKLSPGTYDAIITDYQMPEIDGLEALRKIKGDAQYASLPVIVCSGDIRVKDEVKEAGGIFVNKPVTNAKSLLGEI